MSPRRREPSGRIFVTGPDDDVSEGRPVESIGAGISFAQGVACRHLGVLGDELTYYVQELSLDDEQERVQAIIVKSEDGTVLTVRY